MSHIPITVTQPDFEEKPFLNDDSNNAPYDQYRDYLDPRLFDSDRSRPSSPSGQSSWSDSPSPAIPQQSNSDVAALRGMNGLTLQTNYSSGLGNPHFGSALLNSTSHMNTWRSSNASPYALRQEEMRFSTESPYSPQRQSLMHDSFASSSLGLNQSFHPSVFLPDPSPSPTYSQIPSQDNAAYSDRVNFMGVPPQLSSQQEQSPVNVLPSIPENYAAETYRSLPTSDATDIPSAKGKNSSDLKRNPEVMRKEWMSHYGKFMDESKLLKIFSKRAKSKVATLNGLKASTARRTNPARFKCEIEGCNADFTRKHNLENHMKSHYGVTDLACTFCGKGFTTIPVKKRHQATCQSNPSRKANSSKKPIVPKLEFI